MFFRSPKKIRKLYEQALQDLEEEQWVEALAKAAQLRRDRFSGAFEIEARAYLAQDQPQQAVLSLREGVSVAPQVFALQLMLGTTLSELGETVEARQTLENARRCPGADSALVDFNLAVVLQSEARPQDALECCPTGSSDPGLQCACSALRATLLNQFQRFQEAEAVAGEGLATPGEQPLELRARLFQSLAMAAWGGRRDTEACLQACLSALVLDAFDSRSQALVEEILSDELSLRRYSLMVRGRWHEPVERRQPPPHFYRRLQVVAGTPEEARTLAAQEEPSPVVASVEIEELEDLGAFPARYRGVLYRIRAHLLSARELTTRRPDVRGQGKAFQEAERKLQPWPALSGTTMWISP